jgi:hypothetical protein
MPQKQRTAPKQLRRGQTFRDFKSALAGLEARICLVDDINPALAADQLVVAMALQQSLQRITDFHGLDLWLKANPALNSGGP